MTTENRSRHCVNTNASKTRELVHSEDAIVVGWICHKRVYLAGGLTAARFASNVSPFAAAQREINNFSLFTRS